MIAGRPPTFNYGASDSRVRLDLDRHDAEVKQCSARFSRDFVSPPKLAGAMVGAGGRNARAHRMGPDLDPTRAAMARRLDLGEDRSLGRCRVSALKVFAESEPRTVRRKKAG